MTTNQSPIEPMNFNEQLREILWQVHKNGQWFATPIAEQKPHSFGKDVQEAETTIHTLIEEAYKDAKPELPASLALLKDFGVEMYKKGTDEYEASLRAKFNVEEG